MKKIINIVKQRFKLFLMFINEFKYSKNLKTFQLVKNNLVTPYIEKNIEIEKIDSIDISDNLKGKFVGAVNYNDVMYCIPNKLHKFLKLNLSTNEIEFIDFNYDNIDEFLWSGGCIYNNKIYGYPRYSNDLICLNPENNKVSIINLNIQYSREHHYSGVCTKDGIVYQPPRSNNTILVINLNDYTSREIVISPSYLKYNYATGIISNNGRIYFFPCGIGKVMILDPTTEKISFIGKNINCSVFGPCVGSDNNIYGFSSYCKGILKIDTDNNSVKMIHAEIGCPGCYGNKLGPNGNIYGIPGNGNYIWEYNPEKNAVKKIKELSKEYAKCAGGVVAKDGTIYTVPAFGNKIYIMRFNKKVDLSSQQLYLLYNNDCY